MDLRSRTRACRPLLVGLFCLLALPAQAGEWAEVLHPRAWSFPRDHGAHPAFRTEWWYFTGNLLDRAGNRYGYQLTFFRQGLRVTPAKPENPWSIRDVYLAHFAVTDAAAGRFRFSERASRAGPGLAAAAAPDLDVRTLDWSARSQGPSIRLKARTTEAEIDLLLTPRKPLVFHGDKGLSRKGPRPGQASYYVSFTDLETRGSLRAKPGGPAVPVAGKSWFDHELGSNQLGSDQQGWDWLGLHLSDGRDVMVYLLRRQGGGLEPASSGTLVEPGGFARHLPLSDLSLEELARWRSPRTGARYPSRWRLRIATAGIDVTLSPLIADQELVTEGSTGVTYWEGAVEGSGSSGGRGVSAEGYVELTGYGGKMGGLF